MIKYEHDCDTCIHLGGDDEYDFYYCHQAGLHTVIARYGNSGESYTSGMASALADEQMHPDFPLVKALKLARQKGLVE